MNWRVRILELAKQMPRKSFREKLEIIFEEERQEKKNREEKNG